MRRFYYILMMSAILAACNKDEEIVVDNPSEEPSGVEFTVVEYLPAPGQFINEKASGFDGETTMQAACSYAQGRLDARSFVSLGAWGGSITVKCSRPIDNSGGYDFIVAGNAFETSNEAGIVWVMKDTNGNGVPDDVWYELKGSCYGEEGFERNYWVTYFRPENSGDDIRWIDCHGTEGVIKRQMTHTQDSYFPAWVTGDSYTLHGSRLPALTRRDEAGQWVNPPYKWGYADNLGEDSKTTLVEGRQMQLNYFRISDAVDADGQPAGIDKVDFIKVQTAINGSSGILGELSTEVCGFFTEL